MRAAVALYITLTVFLLGFGLAAVTAGAPAAVATGVLGLIGTLAAVAVRIDGETPPAARTTASHRGSARRPARAG